MTRAPLSNFQVDVLLGAHDGLTNAQIAKSKGSTPGSIANSLRCIKRKGYAMPEWRPREPKAEQEYRERVRLADAVERFTAKGIHPKTGVRISVTSDTQEIADAALAAMLGGGK